MAVYVDTARHRLGRMIMCHMWADTEAELVDMARRIGMSDTWIQRPPQASWVHYDVSLERKRRALDLGAILTDKYGPIEHVARLSGDTVRLAQIAALRARHAAARERVSKSVKKV